MRAVNHAPPSFPQKTGVSVTATTLTLFFPRRVDEINNTAQNGSVYYDNIRSSNRDQIFSHCTPPLLNRRMSLLSTIPAPLTYSTVLYPVYVEYVPTVHRVHHCRASPVTSPPSPAASCPCPCPCRPPTMRRHSVLSRARLPFPLPASLLGHT